MQSGVREPTTRTGFFRHSNASGTRRGDRQRGLADAFARQLYGDLGDTRIGLVAQDDDAVLDTVVFALDVTGMHHVTGSVQDDATA